MKRITLFSSMLLMLILQLLPLQAQSMDELQKHFIQRKGQIDSLLKSGKIGENNQGFLEEKSALATEEKALVTDENSDRKKVYAIIAEKNGTTPESVGKIRAKKIQEQLSPGSWHQDDSGAWKK